MEVDGDDEADMDDGAYDGPVKQHVGKVGGSKTRKDKKGKGKEKAVSVSADGVRMRKRHASDADPPYVHFMSFL